MKRHFSLDEFAAHRHESQYLTRRLMIKSKPPDQIGVLKQIQPIVFRLRCSAFPASFVIQNEKHSFAYYNECNVFLGTFRRRLQ